MLKSEAVAVAQLPQVIRLRHIEYQQKEAAQPNRQACELTRVTWLVWKTGTRSNTLLQKLCTPLMTMVVKPSGVNRYGSRTAASIQISHPILCSCTVVSKHECTRHRASREYAPKNNARKY